MTEKKRNTYVDFLRGVAMLIVVLGHTMTGSASGSKESVFFNIVWSLQIPMFILISGYVTRYSRIPDDTRGLFRLLGKRSLAYLLPWFVFTVLLNGIVLGKQELAPGALFFHMDSGYWFLFSLWTISMIFIPARFVALKLSRKEKAVPFVTLCFYLIGMALLGGIGFLAGFDFWCIKLTLYYMPFYCLGYLYGCFRDSVTARFSSAISVITAICGLAWIVSIIKLDLFSLSDTRITDILIRAGVSLCGCIFVSGVFSAFGNTGPVFRFVEWIGVHSMEVYLLHYYFLNLAAVSALPELMTAKGLAMVAANYLIAVVLTSTAAKLLSSNRYLNLILFGKPEKKR